MVKNIAIVENNILATNTIRRKLTKSLISEGYSVTVLTTGTKDEIDEAVKNGINVIDVKSGSENIIEILNYIRNLKHALKRSGADVCLTFTIRPNVWGNFISRYLNIPVISNITGIGPLFKSNAFSYKVARVLYRMALKKTKTVFFQNDDDKELFLKHGFVRKAQLKVIPGSGVDTSWFVPMESSTRANFTFLFIGRLIRDKGIVEYIEAARLVKRKLPGTIFKVIGPLWQQNIKSNTISKTELDSWIGEGLIQYEGSATDVRAYIADADCIVIPSYREGMSNVLLEAGSMEKPCIATNVTGCREIVEHNVTGLLCEPANTEDLAFAMLKMIELDEATRIRMGRKARQKMISQFEKSMVIREYLDAIRNI